LFKDAVLLDEFGGIPVAIDERFHIRRVDGVRGLHHFPSTTARMVSSQWVASSSNWFHA
jgi:hypothetical protein